MQIKKRFYSAFLVVLLTASSLLIFICINILSTSPNNPHIPIPIDVKWIIRLDAESYIKREVYNTLFTEKDDVFIQQLRDIYENNTNEESKKKSLHLDLQEDAVVYGIERDGKNLLVIAVQTQNSSAFNENILDYCKSNQIGKSEGHNALFITQLSGKKSSKKELEGYISQLFQAPIIELQKAAPEKNEFIALDFKKLPTSTGFSSLNLSIQHQDEEINLEGELVYPKKLENSLKFGLKPKGVYIYSRFISEKLPDTLLNFLPAGIPHFKDIQAYAVDFKGTYLEDPKDSLPSIIGFLPTPVMNLIIQTKNKCKVEDLWKSFPKSVRKSNLTLSFGNTVFHLKQLSENTYFIGVDPSAIIPYSGNDIFFIKGHLEKSTKIYGSTFVTAFIENMGPVKAFNDFLKSTESINIEIKPKKGTLYAIIGQIKFKKTKYPLHEISKMVLTLSLFDQSFGGLSAH
ncbi:hypothetical protein [Fluviicola taffensis]|uniref:DUF3352 domain-containing protein n=1 Tax=Fluviicola taffensis (strain DSM 16823 / NCIMB 13979 / RW262) TaxID=755732 RepID=F2IIK2_FLUTR|nr:hypothetical protein [Fluviicola taffensis]AEA45964.1 hypothetical protein Fluta_4001 [Fluviicola taffensis DSM 16823]